ncbi:MAG: flagellar hook-length control protein FliK [Caulobacteraceae bacterium]
MLTLIPGVQAVGADASGQDAAAEAAMASAFGASLAAALMPAPPQGQLVPTAEASGKSSGQVQAAASPATIKPAAVRINIAAHLSLTPKLVTADGGSVSPTTWDATGAEAQPIAGAPAGKSSQPGISPDVLSIHGRLAKETRPVPPGLIRAAEQQPVLPEHAAAAGNARVKLLAQAQTLPSIPVAATPPAPVFATSVVPVVAPSAVPAILAPANAGPEVAAAAVAMPAEEKPSLRPQASKASPDREDPKAATPDPGGKPVRLAQAKPIEPVTARQSNPGKQEADNFAVATRREDKSAKLDPAQRITAEQALQATSAPIQTARAAHTEVRGSPQTVAALSAEIARKLEAQHTRFEVALDPAGLGKVNVKIEIGPSGAIAAAMSFDNPQSAEALKSRANELQAALHSAGFDVADNGLSFTAGGMDHGQAQQRDSRASGPAFTFTPITDEEGAALTALPFRSRSADGRLDIRI